MSEAEKINAAAARAIEKVPLLYRAQVGKVVAGLMLEVSGSIERIESRVQTLEENNQHD